PANGDVYFEVDKFERYGQLAHRTEEGQLTGVRMELEPGKKDPRDFALWKAAKPGEPSWPSPWGEGRPGWHIECSAMVRETLGALFDLVREINRRRAAGEPAGAVAAGQATLRSLAAIIGLHLDAPAHETDSADAGPFIELLLTTRQRLREAKQWALADEIRNQ